jgi:regulator of sirC expression with transglutaminase-like and TPR domain
MSAPSTIESSTPLTNRQISALIKLLSDEDPPVYQAVREKILSCGPQASLWLRPHTLSSDPLLRRRVLEIVQHLARQEADNRFLAFCLQQGEEFDIEEGAWSLAQTQYPDINVLAYQALFDSYAGELREQINYSAGAHAILGIINRYVFSHLGFVGNQENYYDPDNSYLNRVMDRRTGNPVSLCLVYMLLARRLRLPVTGIGMPGHFLCRFQSFKEEVYIDAFNQGRLLAKADCIKYLYQTGQGYREEFLGPLSPRRMLLRICSNLHKIYVDLNLAEETARFQRYIVALGR